MTACPACNSTKVVETTPITRTTRKGERQVIAHRLSCTRCNYTDRTANFKGALSLNNIVTNDELNSEEDGE
jgi:transposase-like protein